MSDGADRYARWMSTVSERSRQRAVKDQAVLARGRMNDGNAKTRYTEAGLSKSHYDNLRFLRDDLDFREWMEDAGFSGMRRVPTGPGMSPDAGVHSEAQARRIARKAEIDEGF